MNRVRMNHTFSMRSHEGLITGAVVKRGRGCLLGDETEGSVPQLSNRLGLSGKWKNVNAIFIITCE